MNKKYFVFSLVTLAVVILGIVGYKIDKSNYELLGNFNLFNHDKENKSVGHVVSSEETLNLKEIEEEKEIIVAEVEEDVVVVDKPVVLEKENKKEITKDEVADIQKVEENQIATIAIDIRRRGSKK